jgi:hypothetical protein
MFYVAALLYNSCEDVIVYYNTCEVNYLNEGPAICYNHNIFNSDKSIAKIIATFNYYNKNLLSKANNSCPSLNCSLKITKEIAFPLEIPEPEIVLHSLAVIKLIGYVAIFKEQHDIFRPPELIGSTLI